MGALTPSSDLRVISEKISNRIHGCMVLQLRIEKDWRRYIGKKVPEFGLLPGEVMLLDAKSIFRKIAETESLSAYRNVYACCDEADLEEEVAEIKADAKEFGLDLLFKSDVVKENNIEIPSSRFLMSVIDFDVALRASIYVGLTRSTFSNALAYVNSNGRFGVHYIYNALGKGLVVRNDGGMKLSPADIIKIS